MSGKYSPDMLAMRQNLVDHAKWSATDTFEAAFNRAIQETAEVTGGLIGNKITNKITKAPKNSQQNNLETATNKSDQEITKKRYMSSEEKQHIFDELILK